MAGTQPTRHASEDIDQIVTSAIGQARRARDEELVSAVLTANLNAATLTTGATLRLNAPVDLPGDERLRLLEVEVTAMRTLGTSPSGDSEPGEAPYVTARGFVQPLKADNTPHPRRNPHWIRLPDELVAPLLGRAHTA